MKKNFMKVAFAALCLTGIQSFTSSSYLRAETIIFSPIAFDPPFDDGTRDTNPHRAPQQILLPYVEIDDACDELTFSSDFALAVDIDIKDAQETTVVSQTLMIHSGKSIDLSILDLPTGEYSIFLYLGDNIYRGVFTK